MNNHKMNATKTHLLLHMYSAKRTRNEYDLKGVISVLNYDNFEYILVHKYIHIFTTMPIRKCYSIIR